jgi:hypothetical protein
LLSQGLLDERDGSSDRRGMLLTWLLVVWRLLLVSQLQSLKKTNGGLLNFSFHGSQARRWCLI